MSPNPAILVTGADLAPQAMALLADYEVVFAGKAPDEDGLVALCEKHQPVAIIVRYGKITARVLAASKALRVISKHGSGIDTIDSKAAAAQGVAVRAALGANADAVAEHAWALILAASRRLEAGMALVRQGRWRDGGPLASILKGERLGLIGFGEIGQRVGRVGAAFGMEVVTWSPHMTAERAAQGGAKAVSLEELLATSKVVSLHLVPSDATRGLLDAGRLATMRPDSILVNTARSTLVDMAALPAALKAGRPGMAAVDVFDEEPLPAGNPLAKLPNAVLTPHVGFVAAPVYEKFARGMVECLEAWLAGKPLVRTLS